MNDPVAAPARWALLALLAGVVLLRPAASPWVVRIAVLGLAGLAVLPMLGWLRTLWFAPVGAAGVAAWLAAAALQHGQAAPVAIVVATVAGGALGAVVAVVTQLAARAVRPWVSLLFAVAVWAALLPRLPAAPMPPPLLFGINLASDQSLALGAVGLLAGGVGGLGNLARTRAGRQIGAAGSAPTLALRRGATPTAVWLRAGAISGVLAGWSGLVLALDAQSVPAGAQFSPATAITWLAVPLIGGPAWVSGVLLGALIVGVIPAAASINEAAIAGLGLAVVALTHGRGIVGEAAARFGRST